MSKPTPTFNKRTPNYIGKVGEKSTQKTLGGRLTPASRGGDLQCEGNILIEKKSTVKKSIVLKQDYLEKIDRIAFEGNKKPILVVEFETLKKNFCNSQWAVVPIDFFKELIELYNKI